MFALPSDADMPEIRTKKDGVRMKKTVLPMDFLYCSFSSVPVTAISALFFNVVSPQSLFSGMMFHKNNIKAKIIKPVNPSRNVALTDVIFTPTTGPKIPK